MINPLHIPWWTSKNMPQELTANGLLKFACLKAFLVHYQNYDQFIGNQLCVSSDGFIKIYPKHLLNMTVKINLILKCRFFRRYLIIIYYLLICCFFQIVLHCRKKLYNLMYLKIHFFLKPFLKNKLVMHHVSWKCFIFCYTCAILPIYTMGHITVKWKTSLECGYSRWACIFSLTFLSNQHLLTR